MPRALLTAALAFLMNASLFCAPALANDGVAENTSPLFSSYDTLSFTLEAPFSQFVYSKSIDHDAPAKILIGDRVVLAHVRLRGHSTLGACDFPKVMLKIDQKSAKGTPFEGVKKVDLNTHCTSNKSKVALIGAEEHPHREALVYRWLKILGLSGYASRPAQVVYRDNSPVAAMPESSGQAALIEHLSSFSKRAGGVEIRGKGDARASKAGTDEDSPKYIFAGLDSSPQLLKEPLARIALFESLIGNFDWGFYGSTAWNMKIIELKDGKWLTIPMDFNLANVARGDKSIAYSKPDTKLLDLVDDATKLRLIEEFESKKDELAKSLSVLEGDSAGQAAFQSAIDSMAGNFDPLKPVKQ